MFTKLYLWTFRSFNEKIIKQQVKLPVINHIKQRLPVAIKKSCLETMRIKCAPLRAEAQMKLHESSFYHNRARNTERFGEKIKYDVGGGK